MKKIIYFLGLTALLFSAAPQALKADICSTLGNAGIWKVYATYSNGVLDDELSLNEVYAGQVVYYRSAGPCSNERGWPSWTVTGGISGIEFKFDGDYVMQVTWGSPGTGTITGYGSGRLVTTILNSCNTQGNISGAYSSYDPVTNTLSGALTYPASVSAGSIVYYKSSISYSRFLVTNGNVLATYYYNSSYTIAKVEWGDAGTGSIRSFVPGACPFMQTISVTAIPELAFDGVNDRVQIGHHTNYNIGASNFTIEAWIKASTTQNSAEATIFSKRLSASDGIWFGLDQNGYLTSRFPDSTPGWTDNVNLRDDKWHHVAMTRSSRSIAYYVDGMQVGAASTARSPGSNLSTSAPIWIGDDPVTNNAFTGSMKGVRFWNNARTDEQLKETWTTNLNAFQVNLIGCWDMEHSNLQRLTDRSVNANNGQLGSTSSVDNEDPQLATPAPFIVNALLFDGNDDRVKIADHSSYSFGIKDFTIEAWVYVKSSFNKQTIFSKRTSTFTGLWMGVSGSGVLMLEMGNTVFTSSSPDLRDAGWKHVAVTRTGTTLAFYVDGLLQGNATSNFNVTTLAEVWLGNDIVPSVGLDGMIDEVRLWNVGRTQADISAESKALYLPNLTQSTNLVGWWRFNASIGQVDADHSSKGNSARLGDSNASTAELTDPLRIANQAFSGARISAVKRTEKLPASLIVESYPNPFTHTMQLKVTGLQSSSAELTVISMQGKRVYQGAITEEKGLLLGENFMPGLYLVQIKDKNLTRTIKVVKNL